MRTRLALALVLLFVPVRSLAGGGPENLLLVVNGDNGDSVTVAHEYARLRSIPPVNVVVLHGIPAGPVIKVTDFRDRILAPVLAAIRERGLVAQIDYIVYSAGFPYGVDVSEDMEGRLVPRYITLTASLTGLTYLCDLVMAHDTDYLSLDANWYARRLKNTAADTSWTDADRQQLSDLVSLENRINAVNGASSAALRASVPGLLHEATQKAQGIETEHPNSPDLLYDLACFFAVQHRPDEAMAMLSAAQRAGWRYAPLTDTDPDLVSLHPRADYKNLLAEMSGGPVEMEEARAFHHATGWSRDGEPAAAGLVRHYYLSAMLAYTGGPANSLDEALESLRTSVGADGTRPRGTIYYMISGDGARTGPREWAFVPAARALAALGVNAEVLHDTLPQSKPDVAGVMVGAAGFQWKSCGSRILPGAFCDHLTSFGAVMTGTDQTLLSEFIRYGAAGASGTVTEPYAIQAKFPNAFLHVYYAAGCSLAEAFYESVTGAYQILLVGDPLCRPWARIPSVRVTGLKPGERVARRRLLRARAYGGQPPTRFELYVDGRRRSVVKAGRPLVLNPAGLAPGLHEARVVAVCGPLEVTGRAIVAFRIGAAARVRGQSSRRARLGRAAPHPERRTGGCPPILTAV